MRYALRKDLNQTAIVDCLLKGGASVYALHVPVDLLVGIRGKTYLVEIKNKKRQIPTDSEFVIKNNRFRYYNNWLTIGGGLQQNLTYNRSLGFAGGIDFNLHIKQQYLQTGLLITGENYNFLTNYQFHVGYAKRFEDKDVQFVIAVGPTFSTGYAKVDDSVYTRHYSEAGFYLQGDIVKKITYDVGVGASLFVDWNQEQTMVGLRFILYFSGSYKGKKHVTYEDNN